MLPQRVDKIEMSSSSGCLAGEGILSYGTFLVWLGVICSLHVFPLVRLVLELQNLPEVETKNQKIKNIIKCKLYSDSET